MKYDVWRLMTGPRAGNVDYLETVEAVSIGEAEDFARLMFDWPPDEMMSIEEAEEDNPNEGEDES